MHTALAVVLVGAKKEMRRSCSSECREETYFSEMSGEVLTEVISCDRIIEL